MTVEHYISSILYIRDNRKVANFASVYFGKRVTVDLVTKVRKQKTPQPMKQYKAIDDSAATKWREAARHSSVEFMKVAG
jgi:hypothetical protein